MEGQEPVNEDADPEEPPPACLEPEEEDANPEGLSPTRRQEPEAPGFDAPNEGPRRCNPRLPSDGP